MTAPSADAPALPPVPDEPWLAGPKPPDEGWTQKKFFLVLAFVLAFHLALIILFGTKKPLIPRAVTKVPHLQLATGSDEFIALNDPTLFARPNEHDLVTAFWRRMPAVKQPDFNWTEPPRYLTPEPGNFGATFRGFIRSSRQTEFSLNLKPEPKLTALEIAFNDAMPQTTTLQISDALGQRQLLNANGLPCPTAPAGSRFNVLTPPFKLPLQPRNDVIEPSQVQAQVDMYGNVLSAMVLKPTADAAADQDALRLARNLRFAPAPHTTFGEITFVWHTVPTNAVTAPAP